MLTYQFLPSSLLTRSDKEYLIITKLLYIGFSAHILNLFLFFSTIRSLILTISHIDTLG